MNYQMSVSVLGTQELKKAFDSAPEVTARELSMAVRKAAIRTHSIAVELAPIQFGPLRGSIHWSEPEVFNKNVISVVGTNMEYAAHQEFGTGIYGPKGAPITPKAKPYLAFKTKSGQWIRVKSVKGTKGKFYFKRAYEKGSQILSDLLRTAMNDILHYLATGRI